MRRDLVLSAGSEGAQHRFSDRLVFDIEQMIGLHTLYRVLRKARRHSCPFGSTCTPRMYLQKVVEESKPIEALPA